MENKAKPRLLFSNDVCSGKGHILHSGKCGFFFFNVSHTSDKKYSKSIFSLKQEVLKAPPQLC
jgi:hypothetical protein